MVNRDRQKPKRITQLDKSDRRQKILDYGEVVAADPDRRLGCSTSSINRLVFPCQY
jgi:hypothetical protein